MNSVKTILFDMDGTILDSRQSVIEAVFKTADHYAPGRFCYSEIEARFGETWDSFTRLVGCPDKDAVVKTYTNFLVGGSEKLIKPFPGVVENLKRLHQQGYKMAIVTNNLRNLAIRSLMLLLPDYYFYNIHEFTEIIIPKQHQIAV